MLKSAPMRIEHLRQRLREHGAKSCHEERVLRAWLTARALDSGSRRQRTEDCLPLALRHELPGLTRECLDLGRRVADRNFKVFIPLLFGKPEFVKSRVRRLANGVSLFCVRREFNLWSENKHSPITDWLRALCRHIHAQCPGPGVGAIGMCLTGGLVISLMVDEALMAPVLSQPSLPFGISAAKREALGVPTEDLKAAKKRAADGLTLLGLRFKGDLICPPERFDAVPGEMARGLVARSLVHAAMTNARGTIATRERRMTASE